MPRRFSCWTGTRLHYQSVASVAAAVESLPLPPGRWVREWIVKAGEGGSWQSEFDPGPLVPSSADALRALYRAGQRLRPRLYVTPYLIVRGRPEWAEAEWRQIGECAAACGRVILNLEPGQWFWNGPTDPQGLHEWLLGMTAWVAGAGTPDWASVYWRRLPHLQLAAIPRQSAVNALGGNEAIHQWLNHAQSAAWECYGQTATDLRADVAIPRIDEQGWLPGDPRRWPGRYRIPIVEPGEVAEVAADPGLVRAGLQVWHI